MTLSSRDRAIVAVFRNRGTTLRPLTLSLSADARSAAFDAWAVELQGNCRARP